MAATPHTADHEPVQPLLLVLAGGLYLIVVLLLTSYAPSGLKLMTGITLLLFTIVLTRQRSSGDLWLYKFLGMNAFVFRGGLMIELPGMTVHPVTKARRQRQFPEEPENVYHGDDRDALPMRADGRGSKMRAFRVLTGKPDPSYAGHLNIQMTVVVTGTMRYHVDPKNPFDFLIRTPGYTDEEKFEEAERQALDTWGRTIMREYEVRPVGRIIDEGETVRTQLFSDLATELAGRGLILDEVNLESPDISHALSEDLAKVGRANAQGEITRVTADNESYRLEKEGKGRAAARLADGIAEGDVVAYQAEKMGVDGHMVFAAQTAERVIGKNDKVLFGADGIAQAVAAGKVIVGALAGGEEKETN